MFRFCNAQTSQMKSFHRPELRGPSGPWFLGWGARALFWPWGSLLALLTSGAVTNTLSHYHTFILFTFTISQYFNTFTITASESSCFPEFTPIYLNLPQIYFNFNLQETDVLRGGRGQFVPDRSGRRAVHRHPQWQAQQLLIVWKSSKYYWAKVVIISARAYPWHIFHWAIWLLTCQRLTFHLFSRWHGTFQSGSNQRSLAWSLGGG